MAGLTPQGLVIETRAEIVTALNAKLRAALGDQFDTSSSGPDGQIIGATADIAARHWYGVRDVYNSQIPSRATDNNLDSVVEWNGIKRIVDRPTAVSLHLSGTTGVPIPEGHLFRANGINYATNFAIVLPPSNEVVVVTAESQTLGAIYIPAQVAWTQPTTTIGGIDSLTNPDEGIMGLVRESDPQLRARREVNTISRGTSSYDAIYEATASLNLKYIYILENDEGVTVSGQPPYSFQVIVDGGTPAEIASIIFDNKPGGIKSYGTSTLPVLDNKGIPHNVGLTRPTRKTVECTFVVERQSGSSNDSLVALQQVVFDYINTLPISEDVVWSALATPILLGVPNLRIASWTVAIANGSQDTVDVPISISERAEILTLADITVLEV